MKIKKIYNMKNTCTEIDLLLQQMEYVIELQNTILKRIYSNYYLQTSDSGNILEAENSYKEYLKLKTKFEEEEN